MNPTTQGDAARVVVSEHEEAELNRLLGEWMQTPLTDDQEAILAEGDEALVSERRSWPQEKQARLRAATVVNWENARALQLLYTRSLDSMALIRAKMNEEQLSQYFRALLDEGPHHEKRPFKNWGYVKKYPYIGIFSLQDLMYCATVGGLAQARAAVEALGLTTTPVAQEGGEERHDNT